jgi:MoaA/NifB/PqqE/SkfB family radical SAM enzyme
MSVRLITGWEKRKVELTLACRVILAGAKRWGPFGLIGQLWRYLRDNRNLFAGAGAHYVELGAWGEIYAASALPPINRGRFVEYVLDEVESFNRKGLAPLVFTLLSVSSRCPYRCRYCYAQGELDCEEERLELDTLLDALSVLRSWRVPSVFLTGGEPMMRGEELVTLLDRCRTRRILFWLVTTGWGVDVDLLRRMKAQGLRGLVISLDSSDPAAAIRSKGHPEAFDNAIRAIQAAHEAGLIVSVDTMVPAGSPLLEEQGYQAFLDFLEGHGVHFLNLFPPHPTGAAQEHHLPALPAEDIHRLEALMNASNRRPGGHPLAYAAVVWEFSRGCVGGQQFIYIDPQGEVRACPFLRRSAGNIQDESLAAVLTRLRGQGEQLGCFTAFEGLEAGKRTES